MRISDELLASHGGSTPAAKKSRWGCFVIFDYRSDGYNVYDSSISIIHPQNPVCSLQ